MFYFQNKKLHKKSINWIVNVLCILHQITNSKTLFHHKQNTLAHAKFLGHVIFKVEEFKTNSRLSEPRKHNKK